MAHLRVCTLVQKFQAVPVFKSLKSVILNSNSYFLMQDIKRSFSYLSNDSKNNNAVKLDDSKICKSVFISQSNDVFTNLALEDWLYKNFDFTNHHVMLFWVNSPCVVIGRHQNPWLESNCRRLSELGVQLARRNSGGGTVYHDNGNLNVTFFTPRGRYNRRQNLEIINSALHREWGLKTEINKKEDIVIDGTFKISGTASKLGTPNSYHHCTLLVDVNKRNLGEVLDKCDKGIDTKATASIPSPVKNLSEVNSNITVERLISAIGWEYLRTSALSKEDKGWEFVAKQKGFQMINPTDEWFPGLYQIQSDFESWEWKYGRTPTFHITRSFSLPQNISSNKKVEQLQVTVTVTSGLVEDIVVMIPPSLLSSNMFEDEIKVMTNLKGRRFTEDALDELNASFGLSESVDNKQFVADCVRQVMASV